MTCGTCHPEALSPRDREAVSEFQRFLAVVSSWPHYVVNGREKLIVPPEWHAYIQTGEHAPPLLWEGENA